jgi:hypothetical protein
MLASATCVPRFEVLLLRTYDTAHVCSAVPMRQHLPMVLPTVS